MMPSVTASLEFALLAIPFVFLLIAERALGRYFIRQRSLWTFVSEAAWDTLVSCYGQGAYTLLYDNGKPWRRRSRS
jgi:hypothetical protein